MGKNNNNNKTWIMFIRNVFLCKFILCIANFGGPFTYNLLSEILLIIGLSYINYINLFFILFISFFSAAYRLILYSNTQQGVNNNLYFSINNINMREIINLFSHS